MSKRVDWSIGIETRYPARTGQCAACDNKLPKGRRRYCSDECGLVAYIQHNIERGNPQVIRSELWKRDGGVCAHCKSQCVKDQYSDGLQWQAHHIIPVSNGGGITKQRKAMSLADYETVCTPCHKAYHAGKGRVGQRALAIA